MNRQTIVLNFGLAPIQNHSSILMRLPTEDERRISELSATAARIDMALAFAAQIGNSTRTGSEGLQKAEGYMRASLAEFVSVEDTLAWERSDVIFKLWMSENPLLHVLRELRNMNVHLQPSKFEPKVISVRFRDERSDPVDMEILTLADFSTARFNRLRNAKRYTESQISDLVEWFNDFHRHWGISDAIHQGVCALASTVIRRYGL